MKAGHRDRAPDGPGEGRCKLSTAATASLAFAYSLWAIGGNGAETVFLGSLLLLAGEPV
jgi:basic amino acid/polyamine antiporter, APA family